MPDDTVDAAPQRAPWSITLDAKDMLAGVGGILMLGGAAYIHPGLAAMLAGAGMIALALLKAR